MRALPGMVVAKAGAEGVQAMGIVRRAIGVAIKVEDGADRPLWPICVAILRRLDVLPESLPAELLKAWQAELKNTRGDRVAFMAACIQTGPLARFFWKSPRITSACNKRC